MTDSDATPLPPNLPPSPRWRGIWLAIPGLFTLVLFSWLPLSYYRMVAWPWMLVWQLAGLGLVIWTLWQLRQWDRPFRGLGHGLDGVGLGLGFTLILACLLSPFRGVGLWNIAMAGTWGLGLYSFRNWVDRGWLTRQRLWLGLVAVASVTALISLGLWRPDAAMWVDQSVQDALRNRQPLGHHNFVGGYFVLQIPLAVAAVRAGRGWQRLLLGLGTGAMVAALYVSGSRGAALGFVIWLVVTWLAALKRATGAWRWRLGLGGLGLFSLVGAVLFTNPRIRAWLSEIPQGFTITDGPTLDRWFMLRTGANMLRDHPWFGVGPGAMGRVSNLYRPIETGAGLDHVQQLHNTLLQVAGELGLVGLGLGLVGLGLAGRLWWWLGQQPLTAADRALLGGIGGSTLAYGVSSLTDYQLENIPITGTLVGLLLLLLALGDHYRPPVSSLTQFQRRSASLGVWGWWGLVLYIWLRFALTVGFDQMAANAFNANQFTLADSRWQRAAHLSPWDPTAGAVASQGLHQLLVNMGPGPLRQQVRSLMLDYAHQAQIAAPNDVWFNQNLAVMYQGLDAARALPFAQRSVQLLPRHLNYGYFLLGQLLLAQGQTRQAVVAFSLEALVRPESLTLPLWQATPLESIYPQVIRATLTAYDQLLAQVSPSTRGASELYANRVMLGWWTHNPMPNVDLQRLHPVAQAVLQLESDPPAAQALIATTRAHAKDSPELQLLATWLGFSDSGFAPPSPVQIPATLDPAKFEASLAYRQLRPWLQSIQAAPSQPVRVAVALSYRNYQARSITLMLRPETIQHYPLITALGLFEPWPREFPALDRALTTLADTRLDLPHPTRNRFRLSTPTPS